jgi:hypothetical protein
MNIPTAEELYKDTKINPNLDLFSDDVKHLVELMKEFAKFHVEAALKVASEVAFVDLIQTNLGDCEINKKSILYAYPLENIK